MKAKLLLAVSLTVIFASANAALSDSYLKRKLASWSAIVYNSGGIQPRDAMSGLAAGRRFTPLTFSFSPESSGGMMSDIISQFSRSTPPKDQLWDIHRLDSNGQGAAFTLSCPGFSTLTFPPLVVNSQSVAMMSTSLECTDRVFKGVTTIPPNEADAQKSERSFTSGRFILMIDGISSSSSSTTSGGAGCVRIEPITVGSGFVGSDGLRHLTLTNLEMTVSSSSSSQYFTWLFNELNGIDDPRMMQLTLLHADGKPMCRLSVACTIDSVGPVDFLSLQSSACRVVCRPVGKVSMVDFH